jgi:hypothetical protein
MKIKMFGLAALAALMAMALAGASSAMAESTTLCTANGSGCGVTHVHETTLSGSSHKAKLLGGLITVACDVLFLGDALAAEASPLVIHGNFTYTNCGSCTVAELKGGVAKIEVLKEGHETAKVTGEAVVFVDCGGESLECEYDGVGLESTAKGPLLSTETNGESKITNQIVHKHAGGGALCPEESKLDITMTPLSAIYISNGPPPTPSKTALCATDEATSTCLQENKPSTVDFKDSAVEFLTNLLNFKCEGLVSGSVGAAGKPQEVKAEHKYSGCASSCVVTEVGGGSKLFFLDEGVELAKVTTEGLELFVKCGTTIKCTFGPATLSGDGLGALTTKDNGHITFSKASLGEHEGSTCPTEASLDALFVASSPTYIREDYALTALCSKDEGTPICKSENQLKSIDYKDKAVELLTNLINVKCEGLASGTVGSPANPLEIKAELTYTVCSGGCFVTDVSGPGKIMLQREGKAEEASATSEGFEIFVKCGTTIKCLFGPEKMASKALGALTTGDNGHLTFTKVSMGKGEGATCPSEATLDALYVASSSAYIG